MGQKVRRRRSRKAMHAQSPTWVPVVSCPQGTRGLFLDAQAIGAPRAMFPPGEDTARAGTKAIWQNTGCRERKNEAPGLNVRSCSVLCLFFRSGNKAIGRSPNSCGIPVGGGSWWWLGGT